MDSIYIIRKPLITEKSTYHSNEHNRFTFEVDATSTKTEIKKAIEDLYRVRVVGVSTVTQHGRNKRMRYGTVKGKTTKKAIVRVHDADTIELF